MRAAAPWCISGIGRPEHAHVPTRLADSTTRLHGRGRVRSWRVRPFVRCVGQVWAPPESRGPASRRRRAGGRRSGALAQGACCHGVSLPRKNLNRRMLALNPKRLERGRFLRSAGRSGGVVMIRQAARRGRMVAGVSLANPRLHGMVGTGRRAANPRRPDGGHGRGPVRGQRRRQGQRPERDRLSAAGRRRVRLPRGERREPFRAACDAARPAPHRRANGGPHRRPWSAPRRRCAARRGIRLRGGGQTLGSRKVPGPQYR